MKNITFISAGAGSGKTYSLTEELYSYIASGQCRGNQVLLTTFTKKAAEEIKQRAYEKLFAEGKVEDAILLQDAFTGTIHSIGFRFIRKFCYLIGLSPDMREMTEEDSDFYFTQAISAIPSSGQLERLDHLCRQFDFQKSGDNFSAQPDPEKWKLHVQEIIKEARRNRISDLSKSSLSVNKTEENFTSLFSPRQEAFLDNDELKKQAEKVIQFVENLPDNRNEGRKTKIKNLKSDLQTGKLNYSLMISLFDAASDVLDKVDGTHQPSINLRKSTADLIHSDLFIKDLMEYTSLIFDIASESLEEFEKYKNEHALIDYTDMEARFLDLLDIPEVQAEIKARISFVLVDEFQDSNPVQLDIIRKLSEIAGKAIWVGDPKQSIFGFNGADPALVNQILDMFYAENDNALTVKLLKNSWRSRSDLVACVNQIFEVSLKDQSKPIKIRRQDILGKPGTLKTWLDDKFKDNDSIELSAEDTIALIPVRSDENTGFESSQKHLPLKHWHFTNPMKRGGSGKEVFRYYLARKIRDLLQDNLPVMDKKTGKTREMVPADIAVLCRKVDDVAGLASELLKNGLEVAAIVEGLTGTAEYRLLVNMLNYLADPSNSLAIAELMLLVKKDAGANLETVLEERIECLKSAREQFGKDSDEYYKEVSSWGKDHFLIKKLDEFSHRSRHLSVPELMEKLNIEMELPRYVSAWGNAGQRKANLQQLIKYAYEYDDYCLRLNLASGIAGFVNWLSSRKEKDIQSASENENAVNVVTYHKAKGLEWPLVILFGLDYTWNGNLLVRDFFRTSVRSEGAFDVENPLRNRYILFSFWPFGKKENIMGYEQVIMNSPEYRRKETQVKNETKRLMYVGMTRARDFLVTTQLNGKAPEWLNMVTDKTQDWFGNMQVNAEIINDPNPTFAATYGEFDYTPVHYFAKQDPLPQSNPKYISPSKVEAPEQVSVSLFKNFGKRIRIGTQEDSAMLGNCFHSLLYQRLRNAGLFHLESTIERYNQSGMIDIPDLKEGFDLFAGYIQSLEPVAMYREMPLRMGKGSNIIVGTADLVLECKNGIFLIDYKSYPGKLSNVSDPNDEHFAGIYSGQLKTYAEMLEAALGKKVIRKMIYYPVIGVIMEVS